MIGASRVIVRVGARLWTATIIDHATRDFRWPDQQPTRGPLLEIITDCGVHRWYRRDEVWTYAQAEASLHLAIRASDKRAAQLQAAGRDYDARQEQDRGSTLLADLVAIRIDRVSP